MEQLTVSDRCHCTKGLRPLGMRLLFQSEAKCKAIYQKMIFYSHVNKTEFHKKGFALHLILKVRVFGTWKWPIIYS